MSTARLRRIPRRLALSNSVCSVEARDGRQPGRLAIHHKGWPHARIVSGFAKRLKRWQRLGGDKTTPPKTPIGPRVRGLFGLIDHH